MSDDRVVNLRLVDDKAGPSVVDVLERCLEKARKGELHHVVVVGVTPDYCLLSDATPLTTPEVCYLMRLVELDLLLGG